MNGVIKRPTLLKYVKLNLVEHYRIGVRSPGSKKDTRPIIFSEQQLDKLMEKFLVKRIDTDPEQELIKRLFQKKSNRRRK